MAGKPTYEELGKRVQELEKEAARLKQAEEELQRSEERFRTVADFTYDWEYWIGPDGKYIYVSPSCKRITGYGVDEFLKDPGLLEAITHPDDRSTVSRHIQEELESEKVLSIDFRIITNSGQERWIGHFCQPVYSAEERFLGRRISNRDISNRKRAEERLERLGSIIEFSDDAIIAKTLDGVIVSWNKAAEKIYGYTKKEAEGNPISMLVPPDRPDEVPGILEKIKAGQLVHHFETIRQRKDGTLVDVSLTISPIKETKGKIIGASTIARDISKRKQAEEQLRRINEELKNFVHIVSHDLKTPITYIQGFSSVLLDKYKEDLDDKGRKCLERIDANVRRMDRLVSDLLALSRIGRVVSSFDHVPCLEIVGNVTSGLQDRLKEKGIELVVADNLPTIRCDGERIYQVFENLLVNAIKFIGDTEGSKIEIGYQEKGRFHRFYVRDNGIGIDSKHHRKIFEKFHRLRETQDHEGTGLGLAIVEKIVTNHGGRVWVDSEKAKGSTFYFTLPK